MKEIHFFTNLSNIEQVSDWDLETMTTDIVETMKSISRDDIVKTTQLSLLRNSWFYIDKGIKVFIHNDNKIIEVKEHMGGTEKDIRYGHNIENLLMAGTFGELK